MIAFESIFKTHFKSLYGYAFLMVRDEALAEEIVQQIFYRVLEKKEKITIHTSFNAYLYKSVHNECLQQQKRKKHHARYRSHIVRQERTGDMASEKVEQKELEKKFYQVLEKLPAQCRLVFQMNRFGGMKYLEIAQELNISLKTVESQMSKALKRLRASLAEFLPLLILFLWQL